MKRVVAFLAAVATSSVVLPAAKAQVPPIVAIKIGKQVLKLLAVVETASNTGDAFSSAKRFRDTSAYKLFSAGSKLEKLQHMHLDAAIKAIRDAQLAEGEARSKHYYAALDHLRLSQGAEDDPVRAMTAYFLAAMVQNLRGEDASGRAYLVDAWKAPNGVTLIESGLYEVQKEYKEQDIQLFDQARLCLALHTAHMTESPHPINGGSNGRRDMLRRSLLRMTSFLAGSERTEPDVPFRFESKLREPESVAKVRIRALIALALGLSPAEMFKAASLPSDRVQGDAMKMVLPVKLALRMMFRTNSLPSNIQGFWSSCGFRIEDMQRGSISSESVQRIYSQLTPVEVCEFVPMRGCERTLGVWSTADKVFGFETLPTCPEAPPSVGATVSAVLVPGDFRNRGFLRFWCQGTSGTGASCLPEAGLVTQGGSGARGLQEQGLLASLRPDW